MTDQAQTLAQTPDQFIALAEALADIARPIVKGYFRSGTAISDKQDASPVTEADRAAETAMRERITETFPEHGILGEEFGPERADADYVWVLDPIDGTKAYVTGKPLFGTLIALTHEGRPIVGVIDQPILDERWLGARGRASTYNGETISTRAAASLADAWLYATSPDMFEGPDADAFARLSGNAKHALYGADCYAYGLLASGYTDLVCEASLKPYDYCAHVPIIEGAGGVITDWSGAPLRIDSDGRVLAAGDGETHQAALRHLQGS
ncbi:MAG: histidinol-phosphatase [Rhodospirillales bacterium]|jgi:inositol-phosphate phosphatase/L-galactose 1-phosphate phosphatase/histidinol-phosphatase|nr:histidinol-phosphatase [Rhodospirillaceae bacterium]MDP6428397.1 histidinol-phosphatase [Rhodospirillales bacterium]MDP6642877.1 histidinol-phosphatase [Rhodospirillales bacterium]MDP6841589.1 histidinol-phosphatase [Rhodospirillales bacterium]